MKKRIIAALLTLALAVGTLGCFALMSGAETPTPQLNIAFCNLSFRNAVCLKYAVEANVSDVKILIWTSPQTEYLVGTHDDEITEYYTEDINQTPHLIFDYTKLTAKQMTDIIYARAYAKVGDVDYYSDINKYSILQYAYNKLGKTATASADSELKEMLVNMLAYGASAQKYLDDYNADRLATAEWWQVKLNDGVLDDGCTHGLYLRGDTVTVTAPTTDASGATFAYWADSKNNKIATTATYELTVGNKNETYTPIYVKYSSGLEFDSNGDGTCYVIGMGDCGDAELVIPPVSPEGDTVIGIDSSAFAGKAITSVSFPNTLEEIARRAFNNCSALTDVYYDGTEEEWSEKVSISSGNDAIENATKHFLTPAVETFEVTFVDFDGTVLKSETVENGKAATAPADPAREDYIFIGWDVTFNNITSNLTVTAQYEYRASTPTILVNNAIASAGSTLTVTLQIINNPGVAGAKFTVAFDAKLTLSAATSGEAFAELDYTEPATFTSGCPFNWDSLDAEATANGTFLTLTFIVSDAATPGEKLDVSVSYVSGDIYDKELQDVSFEIINGTVTVQ